MTKVSFQETEEIVARLRAMVEQEQVLVASGRLEEVASAIESRHALLAQIPLDEIPEGKLLTALREIHAEGDKTLTLLCALRDELSGMLDEGKQVRHAVSRYAGSTQI